MDGEDGVARARAVDSVVTILAKASDVLHSGRSDGPDAAYADREDPEPA